MEQIAPLGLEGGKLPLYKVAVQHLLTPRGRNEPVNLCIQRKTIHKKMF